MSDPDQLFEGYRKCPACNGEGFVHVETENVNVGTIPASVLSADECPVCEGLGQIPIDNS